MAKGTTVPDARIRIVFDKPMQLEELAPLLDDFAATVGFPYPYSTGVPVINRDTSTDGFSDSISWLWFPVSATIKNRASNYYSLAAFSEPSAGYVTELEIILYHKSTQSFTATEWQLFRDILIELEKQQTQEHLGKGSLTITVHPAEDTQCSLIGEASAASGLDVPVAREVACRRS